uniref:Uncharacterized protein n=1 Tax=Lotharella oceanica TaxID=641309 RepID=A0A7S2XBC9_9EUKA
MADARHVPFAVSPCCIGKMGRERGPWSARMRTLFLEEGVDDADVGNEFWLIARWADSELPVGSEGQRRQRRAKVIVEVDRLMALEWGGVRWMLSGPHMSCSPKRDLLVGPASAFTSVSST